MGREMVDETADGPPPTTHCVRSSMPNANMIRNLDEQ
jgi:hypothetical protein